MKYPFREEELKIVKSYGYKSMKLPVFDTPISQKEGGKLAYAGKPVWQSTFADVLYFSPRLFPDAIARGYVHDAGERLSFDRAKDMFGVEWIFEPDVGGAMVQPGAPLMEDANDWQELIKFPDIDSWDWEQDIDANRRLLNERVSLVFFMNGWFERLISFMDFSGAAIALIDEDQQDAVKALFDKLTDLYIKMLDRLFDLYPEIDGVIAHDDWGSQRAPLFSPDTAMEMIVPAMRKFTDHIRGRGKICELHSCGFNIDMVPAYIAAGWEVWNPQTINDTGKIYELYGDRLLVGVSAPELAPDADEDVQRAAAREYAEKYCRPEKPCLLNANCSAPEFFLEELYKQSRIIFSRE